MPKVGPEHVRARKRQILRAACLCFADNGFDGTTVQDICDRAGLSTGAVYSYFDSKSDLVRALARENAEQSDRLFEASEGESLAATLRRLPRLIEEAMEAAAEQAGLDLYRMKVMLWAESLRNPALGDFVERGYAQAVGRITDLFRTALERGETRTAVPPEAAAWILVSLLEGFTLQKAFDPDLDFGRYTEAMESVLGQGLVPGLARAGESGGSRRREER